ncbi:MAG TPA: response regulator [Terriglobales bacterium]|nr:response regulator [Terriglobales bacterium]
MARKILLADDSVTAQNMGRRILSDAGYDVTTVNNGSAALKRIAESKPDLIVLDVYMPGYGGLEVCQRLREAPETARIPVLLTVGKLEPFKADEARRVRADAFIVKPFEASELLTALTKLEDKIVPQGQPSRQSRFAKALAGVEELNPSKEFGDSETGWKNRLSIPPPHSKPREVAPAEPSAVVASFREAVKTEEPKPAEMKSGLEEALLSSMPQDVTAEEIAAIKAAAAAFSAPGNESTPRMRRSTDRAEALIQEPVARVEELPSESAVSEAPQAESVEAITENSTPFERLATADIPAEAMVPVEPIVSESGSYQIDAETGKLGAEEVTAALASLAPTNGHGDATAEHREADKWELGSRDLAARDLVPVTMAVAGATQEFSGPRWIAEPVPLRDDEATLVLEQEMEKAYAAFAAADAGMSFASSPADQAFTPIAEAPTVSSEKPPSAVESLSNSNSSESDPTEPAPQTATSSEESVAPEAEVAPVVAPPAVDAVSESSVTEISESAAYAAAASATSGAAEPTIAADAIAAPSPTLVSSENVPVASEPGERQGESELAAAWANWKQIRESVIGSQVVDSQAIDSQISDSQTVGSQSVDSQISESHLSEQIADAVAEPKADSAETKYDSQSEDSAATGEETSEIANIVDSVLADLKPKLMAEIAKKMGKEKEKRK